MHKRKIRLYQAALFLCAPALLACQPAANKKEKIADVTPVSGCKYERGVVAITGGNFVMGSVGIYREEAPPQDVEIAPFWIDRTEVTTADFRRFVDQTGYITRAEKPVDPSEFPDVDFTKNPELKIYLEPGGAVFRPDITTIRSQMNWWSYEPGANWRYPLGPDKPAALLEHPVTQIAYKDAASYAAWAGGRLPSEAEWEYAALGGLTNRDFSSETPPLDEANSWQGAFPLKNTAEDGFVSIAPAGCFKPNGYGLYDMRGNVWEWTSSWYRPGHDLIDIERQQSYNPAEPNIASKTLKGGSFLCAANYCRRYRPAARQPQDIGLGSNHIGFRLAYDENPQTHSDMKK